VGLLEIVGDHETKKLWLLGPLFEKSKLKGKQIPRELLSNI
jgi:hypothetical protein